MRFSFSVKESLLITRMVTLSTAEDGATHTLECLHSNTRVSIYCSGKNWVYKSDRETVFPTKDSSKNACFNLMDLSCWGIPKSVVFTAKVKSDVAAKITCVGDRHVEVGGEVWKFNAKSFFVRCAKDGSNWRYHLSGSGDSTDVFPAPNDILSADTRLPRCVAHCPIWKLEEMLKLVPHLKMEEVKEAAFGTVGMPLPIEMTEPKRFYVGDRFGSSEIFVSCVGADPTPSWKIFERVKGNVVALEALPEVHEFC
eukprot:33830_1